MKSPRRKGMARVLSALLFFFQAEDGIRDFHVTGVQTCALPILHAFLDGKIGFLDIARCVERVLGAHTVEEAEDLDTVLGADAWARREAEAFVARLAGQ